MRYDDELERAKARRKKTLAAGNKTSERTSHSRTDDRTRRPASQQTRQSNSSSKGRSKAKKRKRRFILFALEALLLLIILIVFFVMSKYSRIKRLDFNTDEIANSDINEEVVASMKGYRNFLIFGVDASDAKDGSLGKGVHADVDIIVSINNETGEIRMVSLYRDTYLNIKNDSYNKLTQAYFEGGPEQAVKAINKNLDLNIVDYATFNWNGVADAINILGGVDVDITDKEFYYINAFITDTVNGTGIGSNHLKKPGPNHLDGIQAVAYARLRKMDTDYQRTERQRLIIQLAMDKAKVADWSVINNLIETVFLKQVATSLDLADVVSLGRNISKYHIGETVGFPFNKESKLFGKKGDCVFPLNLEEDVKQLHTFLFGNEVYTPSATVKSISQKIKSDFNGGSSKTSATKATKSTDETKKKTEEATEHESKSSEAVDKESGTDGTIIQTEPVTGPGGVPSVGGSNSQESTTQEVVPSVPSKEPTTEAGPSVGSSNQQGDSGTTEPNSGQASGPGSTVSETIPDKPDSGDNRGSPGA